MPASEHRLSALSAFPSGRPPGSSDSRYDEPDTSRNIEQANNRSSAAIAAVFGTGGSAAREP
jgi:hypothetical protein